MRADDPFHADERALQERMDGPRTLITTLATFFIAFALRRTRSLATPSPIPHPSTQEMT